MHDMPRLFQTYIGNDALGWPPSSGTSGMPAAPSNMPSSPPPSPTRSDVERHRVRMMALVMIDAAMRFQTIWRGRKARMEVASRRMEDDQGATEQESSRSPVLGCLRSQRQQCQHPASCSAVCAPLAHQSSDPRRIGSSSCASLLGRSALPDSGVHANTSSLRVNDASKAQGFVRKGFVQPKGPVYAPCFVAWKTRHARPWESARYQPLGGISGGCGTLSGSSRGISRGGLGGSRGSSAQHSGGLSYLDLYAQHMNSRPSTSPAQLGSGRDGQRCSRSSSAAAAATAAVTVRISGEEGGSTLSAPLLRTAAATPGHEDGPRPVLSPTHASSTRCAQRALKHPPTRPNTPTSLVLGKETNAPDAPAPTTTIPSHEGSLPPFVPITAPMAELARSLIRPHVAHRSLSVHCERPLRQRSTRVTGVRFGTPEAPAPLRALEVLEAGTGTALGARGRHRGGRVGQAQQSAGAWWESMESGPAGVGCMGAAAEYTAEGIRQYTPPCSCIRASRSAVQGTGVQPAGPPTPQFDPRPANTPSCCSPGHLSQSTHFPGSWQQAEGSSQMASPLTGSSTSWQQQQQYAIPPPTRATTPTTPVLSAASRSTTPGRTSWRRDLEVQSRAQGMQGMGIGMDELKSKATVHKTKRTGASNLSPERETLREGRQAFSATMTLQNYHWQRTAPLNNSGAAAKGWPLEAQRPTPLHVRVLNATADW